MKNVVKEALISKLEDLRNQLVGIDNCYQSVEDEYISEWKFRHITMNNYLSDKAKAVIITRNSDSFNFSCDENAWRSNITLRKSRFYKEDAQMPELNWFSSSADTDDKYNYLSILQILGFLANAMQEKTSAYTSLMDLFDELRVKRNEMYGDIKSDIYRVEDEIRNINRDEAIREKEAILATGTITIPRDSNLIRNLTTGAGKWNSSRFTHLEWIENKGGKTYTVKGYCDVAKWEKGPEQHFEHDRVKKGYLQEAIDDAMNAIAKYEKELAAETVQA
jgi:hypothetical protein